MGWVSPGSKVSGSAPYLSWLASRVAEVLLKLPPEISDWVLNTPWMPGADTISLSSTTATWQTAGPFAVLFGAVVMQALWSLLNASLVSAAHFFEPSPLKVRSTFQAPPAWVSMFAAADDRSVPSTLATSSSILVLLPSSQATACVLTSWIEPAGRWLSLSQVTCGTANWICAGSSATS